MALSDIICRMSGGLVWRVALAVATTALMAGCGETQSGVRSSQDPPLGVVAHGTPQVGVEPIPPCKTSETTTPEQKQQVLERLKETGDTSGTVPPDTRPLCPG
jgi:hypothetical protein